MNRIPRSLKFLALLPFLAAFIISCVSTPKIEGVDGKPLPGSISSIEKIKLGGVDQWILMRGNDVSKPVVLYLHGGPGGALMPLVRHYTGELEKNSIMVVWDQRGAGKSYSGDIPRESMTIEQFVSDAHELVTYLKKRFHKEKIFLIGHSWGSLLGINVIRRYPGDFYAYVGIGQVVDMKENERISWEYAYGQAKKYKNEKAVRELEEVGPPVDGYYRTDMKGTAFTAKGLWQERKWLLNYGGIIHFNSDDYEANIKKVKKMKRDSLAKIVFSSEWTLMDIWRARKGAKFSIEIMWPEVLRANLIRDIPRVDVPVYFFTGRSDYNTPFELVERYYKTLQAPKKEIVWFDRSGHQLIPEEWEKFIAGMLRVIAENKGKRSAT